MELQTAKTWKVEPKKAEMRSVQLGWSLAEPGHSVGLEVMGPWFCPSDAIFLPK